METMFWLFRIVLGFIFKTRTIYKQFINLKTLKIIKINNWGEDIKLEYNQ
jgi:hypothetical protein